MAANRVTTHAVEVSVLRDSVPGKARATTHAVEVAVLRDVVPGANVRVTTHCIEVALLRAPTTITGALYIKA